MNKNWPTKEIDLSIAQRVIEDYALKTDNDSIGLFELVVDEQEKKMDFRLSSWVLALAEYFKKLYGIHQGEFVIRQVISYCITQGQTIH